MKQVWQATDGEFFDTKEEYCEHEMAIFRLRKSIALNDLVDIGAKNRSVLDVGKWIFDNYEAIKNIMDSEQAMGSVCSGMTATVRNIIQRTFGQ